MNLFYEDFPDSIEVLGKKVRIITDFREYIKLLDMINDDDLSKAEKVYLIKEYFLDEIPDLDEAIEQLCGFVSMDYMEDGKRIEESEFVRSKPLFSFSVDYPYILSGFLHDYSIDLCTVKHMHWWKFRMLFQGLSGDTEIKQRIMYRSIDLNTIQDKEERNRIRKIQNEIQLPQGVLSDYEIGDAFA